MIDRRVVVCGLLSSCMAFGCASGTSSPAVASPSAAATITLVPSSAPSTIASAVPSPSSSLPDPVDITTAGALTIPATTSVDWIVVVDGQAWIAGLGDGMGVLDRTGKLQRSIAVTGWCESMDIGFDAVWSASCEPAGIIRIDTKTGRVTRAQFDVPIADSEASVGAGEGAIWVVAGATSDVLLKVDPKTLKVQRRDRVPAGSAGVRAGLGGAWVTVPHADQLIHVDPASGAIVATIAVGLGPRFLAVGEGSVWVMNQIEGSVSRVDPGTNRVTATIDVGEEINGGDIAVGGGSVWVHGGPELLARIDPALDRVTARYGPNEGSGGVAADDDAVWVTEHDIATIWRLPLP